MPRSVDSDEQHDKRITKCLAKIGEANPQVRKEGWDSLRDNFRKNRCSIHRDVFMHLLELSYGEKELSVRSAAFHTILAGIPQLVHRLRDGESPAVATPQEPSTTPTSGGLGEWLWSPLHQQSLVLQVADRHRLRRDEDAAIELARHLGRSGFPRTHFGRVIGGFAPVMADLEGTAAICFVGRLSLYGERAVVIWDLPDAKPRYRFGGGFSSERLAKGLLDPEYHAFVQDDERTGETWIRAEDANGVRTDYGLVRRYMVSWNGQWFVVIQVAGCSSLGTLAAACFAANTLFQPGRNGGLVPVPPGIKCESRLEAFVRAKADLADSEIGWKIRDCELLEMRVDDYVWDAAAFRWRLKRREITLEFREGTRPENYRSQTKPNVEIYLDTRRVKFRKGSENQRLAIELFMLASRQNNQLNLNQLGRQTWIWKDQEAKDANYVRNRLRGRLRHLFDESVVIDGDTVHVTPEIRIKISVPRKPR